MKLNGKESEEIVRKLIAINGYKIIQKNFVSKFGEIDLITTKDSEIVFIEIKSLKNEKKLMLEQSISIKKYRKLVKCSMYWLQKNDLNNAKWRIDFIGIKRIAKKISRYVYIKNAVY